MQTRLRMERYREKMKPTDPNTRTLFDDLTSIQMSGIIDCFLLFLNKLFHKYPLSFWIAFFFLEDVTDHCKIYELPMSDVIQTPSNYQALHEKTHQQTCLRVQHCRQNKDIISSRGKNKTPLKDVSNIHQSGTVLFHYTSYSRHPRFMLSSLNGLVYL
jgi:hypothetical protein